MIILPISNHDRVVNVEVTIRDAVKTKSGVSFDDIKESDILVNGRRFSNSSYNASKEDDAVVQFIRNNSIMYKNGYIVTTRENSDSELYDVYEVSNPPKKVNKVLDSLYGAVVTDMRKEIPNVRRGRYISFKDIGMDEYLTDEKILKLQRIVKEEDQVKWPRLFQEEDILDLKETIDFLEAFQCTVISDTTLPEKVIEDELKAFEILQTRDYRNLKRYYEIAQSNKKTYSKISRIYQLLYNRPLNLIQSNKGIIKQLIKVPNEVDRHEAA